MKGVVNVFPNSNKHQERVRDKVDISGPSWKYMMFGKYNSQSGGTEVAKYDG